MLVLLDVETRMQVLAENFQSRASVSKSGYRRRRREAASRATPRSWQTLNPARVSRRISLVDTTSVTFTGI